MENPGENKPVGCVFHWGFEWKTKLTIFGLPLVHIAVGRNRSTGKLLVAKGIIAIGQFAVGFVAIAQFGLGLFLGLGQFAAGSFAVAQFALGLYFGLGQFATGFICIAQFGLGQYVLAQIGYGKYIWSMAAKDPQALEYFRSLL
ncbi:MAG: hypothetical protein WC301_00740 [Candidatus Omnitrophota bacterium]|jgi:hypothetical protein